jgi:predicted Fe-Mo cluster-binding NifX family protein
MSFEALENENAALGGGAGIQAAQFVASKGVTAVVTGNCGPNAIKVLSAGNVQTYVGQTGIIKDVIEKFKSGGTPHSPGREPPRRS